MYHIKEIFRTIQGEGAMAGKPAIFVRFVGCNMWTGEAQDRLRDAARNEAACPLWCDTDFTKQGAKKYTASEVVQAMREIGGDVQFCVLTGGEPFLQADAPLIRTLHEAGFFVAVETNGTVSVHETFMGENGVSYPPDWIVCSPKQTEMKLKIEVMDELKLVVPDYLPENYPNLVEKVRSRFENMPFLWLQPEDGSRQQQATQFAIKTALQHPKWRVSVQIHKVLGVD